MEQIIKLKNKIKKKIEEITLKKYKRGLEKTGAKFERNFEIFEKKFKKNLKKRCDLVIRLDITNNCNLKCFYCHHKLPKFSNIPKKKLTRKDIEFILKDTGPYVDEMMLSCGHEPLVSNDFREIVSFISDSYPQIKINFCTNAMLLNAEIRKTIVEKQVYSFVFSMDGITKETYEKIRRGGKFEKVVGNILALKKLKKEMDTIFPLVNLTFVMMNSNIHEAPYFPEVCNFLGINYISFQHVVGTAFLHMDKETLFNYKAKFNYYRKKIIENAKKFKIPISIPNEFKIDKVWKPQHDKIISTKEILNVKADKNESLINMHLIKRNTPQKNNPLFNIITPFCKSPFKEIMIIEQEVIKSCPFLSGPPLGNLKDKRPLLKVFFGEEFKKLRKNMFQKEGDSRCKNCPVKNSYLPDEKEFKSPY